MIVKYCDVCNAKLSSLDTGLKVLAGSLKQMKEIHLCESHTATFAGLLASHRPAAANGSLVRPAVPSARK